MIDIFEDEGIEDGPWRHYVKLERKSFHVPRDTLNQPRMFLANRVSPKSSPVQISLKFDYQNYHKSFFFISLLNDPNIFPDVEIFVSLWAMSRYCEPWAKNEPLLSCLSHGSYIFYNFNWVTHFMVHTYLLIWISIDLNQLARGSSAQKYILSAIRLNKFQPETRRHIITRPPFRSL